MPGTAVPGMKLTLIISKGINKTLKEQTWGSIGDPYGQRNSNAYNNVDPLITSYLLDKTAQYHISCALAELRKLLQGNFKTDF